MMNRAEFITDRSICDIDRELAQAAAKFGNDGFSSDHEGYAVLLEEMEEYWHEVKHGKDPKRKRAEIIQVAAMAIRILQELQ
jgi:hypothetical protein